MNDKMKEDPQGGTLYQKCRLEGLLALEGATRMNRSFAKL